jgi:16S rRNA (uracil1498-N3)-methyltransferase
VIPRFFVPQAESAGTDVVLSDEEAAHLTRVLRLSAGERVRVFDGRGREWAAVVSDITRRQVKVRIDEAVAPAPESGVRIALAVAALKGDKMDEVVRDAVMLGVASISPLVTNRTEVRATQIQRGNRIARWQRIAVSSAKQCGRAVVPAVTAPLSLSEVLEQAPGTRIVLVEPNAGSSGLTPLQCVSKPDTVALLVGPEGGWTTTELKEAVAAGSMLVTLGAPTLRADRAPLVAVSALRAVWGDL